MTERLVPGPRHRPRIPTLAEAQKWVHSRVLNIRLYQRLLADELRDPRGWEAYYRENLATAFTEYREYDARIPWGVDRASAAPQTMYQQR